MAPTDPRIANRLRMTLPKLAPPPSRRDPSRGFLGLCGSLLCPGMGHIFGGWLNLGATCFIVMWIMAASVIVTLTEPRYFPYIVILGPVAIVLHFSQCISASRCCRNSAAKMLGDRGTRFGAAILCLSAAIAWQHAATVYLRDNIAEIECCPASSMAPTIVPGDFFLVVRNYPFDRWDLVSINSPLKNTPAQLCKRVVGIPDEELEITGDGLLIDGQLTVLPPGVDWYVPVDKWNELMSAPDPLNAAVGCWGKPIQLASDEYFLLGDNSPASDDSRFFPAIEGHQPGAVPADQIVGRVMLVLWPPAHYRKFF